MIICQNPALNLREISAVVVPAGKLAVLDEVNETTKGTKINASDQLGYAPELEIHVVLINNHLT